LIAKYKKIEGEWSVKDVDRFVEDITGATATQSSNEVISH